MPTDPHHITTDLKGRERVRLRRAARVHVAGKSVPLGAGAEAAVSPSEAERLVRAGDAVRVAHGTIVTKGLAAPDRGELLGLITKSASGGSRRFKAVASTATPDRAGDVIEQTGWRLTTYRRNPVICLAHDYSALPIARATSVAVERAQLIAEFEFPPAGTSSRSDEAAALVEAGILGAVSVGFKPIRMEPRRDNPGWRFLEQELLEISVVPVPANGEALIERPFLSQRSAAGADPVHRLSSSATASRVRELARLQRAAGPTPNDLRLTALERLRREARPDLAARIALEARASGFSRLARRAADLARTAR